MPLRRVAPLHPLTGVKYMLDMSQEGDRKTLVKLVREHQNGGGDFNMVKKDGVDYAIHGVEVADEESTTSDHFAGMKGQAAKVTAPVAKSAGKNMENAIKDKLQYKGLQYTAADFAKMGKSEAEYRRQLMAMSKQELKMELPGGDILNGAISFFGGMFGGKKEEANRDATEEELCTAIDRKLPSKGVLHFRFKVRSILATVRSVGAESVCFAAHFDQPTTNERWCGRPAALQ